MEPLRQLGTRNGRLYTPVKSASEIPAFREKESFGDMDILYTTSDGVPLTVDWVKQTYNPNEIIKNGTVISFDFEELQIDLIHSAIGSFDYGLSYFSWNDAGNLIGKLAHQFGLKHGHEGLFLPLRDGNNQFETITLTLDHDYTLSFLGLDADRFNSGFDNLEDMFNWVAASPYYSPDWYKLENLNSVAKIRDRKRETYNKFLAFGERWEGPRHPKIKDKTVHLERIFSEFRNSKLSFDLAMERLCLQQAAKVKFNGQMVSDITGLVAKDLGIFMKFIKESDEFSPQLLVYLEPASITDRIKKLYSDYLELN